MLAMEVVGRLKNHLRAGPLKVEGKRWHNSPSSDGGEVLYYCCGGSFSDGWDVSSTKKPTEETPLPPPPPKDQHLQLQDRTLVPESDPPTESKQTHINIKKTPQLPSVLLPQLDQEESVKEVLSETTAPKPRFPKFHEQKILRLPSFPKLEEQRSRPFEDVSEVSEICSVSESVSTSALTDERSHEYDEVMQQRFGQSPSKQFQRKRSDSGDFYMRGESPVKRSDQHWLNNRSDVGGKSVYAGQVTRPRNLMQNGVMRDQGESSRRRSSSPATRIDVGGNNRPGISRSQSGKRVVRSLGRNAVLAPEIGQNLEGSKEKWQVKESLEDPLVSLECFIFL
ncbi:hypothetical protein IFM89_015605 [Coptis chinensis]|uniref:Uncharacterized protein n=1 Tax=Coptis chinensis TaxID=261450 RepID=A0A835HYN7_9MAGN|nr:hypothetical protein IFM89_015605 [Coptis chinensis]